MSPLRAFVSLYTLSCNNCFNYHTKKGPTDGAYLSLYICSSLRHQRDYTVKILFSLIIGKHQVIVKLDDISCAGDGICPIQG